MTNRKRKLNNDEIITQSDKKIKNTEILDSNALILPATKNVVINKNESKEPKKLSKKERKNLQKIVKTKEDKSMIRDIYEELKKFNELKPEEAIKSLRDDLKKIDPKNRITLSSKLKPISRRKYKQWKTRKEMPTTIVDNTSPDTSDFSTDEESEIDLPSQVNLITEESEQMISFNNDIDKAASIINESNTEKVVTGKINLTNTLTIDKEITIIKQLKLVPKTFVIVKRPDDVQEARLQLPILGEETTIMEAVEENDIIIISGSTGCGKTTQVPQFLYESGYAKDGYKIGITEPRRIAAISVSERVKYEMSCQKSDLVSFHVRFQNTSTCNTKIKFMTDGILLQELKNDYLLQNYSAIIIDEAHERTVYTDVLIGILSIVVRARRFSFEKSSKLPILDRLPPRPLKLIIMSATLRIADFAENRRLFPGDNRPPVVTLDGRQFPVQVTFSKHTRPNYLEEAFKMIKKVHNESVEGGILVFVTGQLDCLTLCRWLKKAYPVTQNFLEDNDNNSNINKSQNTSKSDFLRVNLKDFSIIPLDEESEQIEIPKEKNVNEDEDEVYDSDEETPMNYNNIINCVNPIYALPLYSLLDKEKQEIVFKEPPKGQRLVVIATNVAETSLTIPNIKYVIDTGLEKVKKWDKITGISKFTLDRISKSSAEQRKGRAGRVGPGQCFRLYSSAVYEEMKEFSIPEICQRPVDDVVLLLRNFIHSSIPIHKFCLPTIPSEEAIDRAERMLISLGALRRIKGSKTLSDITEMGKSMTQIPLSPRLARMLLLSNQQNLLPYALLVASLLSVSDFFIIKNEQDTPEQKTDKNHKKDSVKKKSYLMLGDITVLLAAFFNLEKLHLSSEQEAKQAADERGVRWQAFIEVKKLRKQLTGILNSNVKNLDLSISVLPIPSDTQFEQLRQLILIGTLNNVAVLAPPNMKEKRMYLACNVDRPVFLHSKSVIARDKFEWVVFQDLYENVSQGETSKPFIRNLTVIEPEWLPLFCTLNCAVERLFLENKPETKPIYDMTHDKIMAFASRVFYGERRLQLPEGIRVPVIYEIMENEERQGDIFRRWFARFFLEGVIFTRMELWRSKMKSISKPEMLLSPHNNSRSEIMSVMRDICTLDFPSKKSINDRWKLNTNFLLDSYLEWIRPDERDEVIASWPPFDI